jgi:hypothetical protein
VATYVAVRATVECNAMRGTGESHTVEFLPGREMHSPPSEQLDMQCSEDSYHEIHSTHDQLTSGRSCFSDPFYTMGMALEHA